MPSVAVRREGEPYLTQAGTARKLIRLQEKEKEYLEVLNRNWKSRTRDIADVLTEMEEWLKSKPDDAVSIVSCP